ncbi:MAG: hypothetical protein ASARMPRED_002292 [Alectoria sarmentosa]|nr:MAG: hypothetical protein ASARMPRED_002292 [Alectoria sarmentosa]
MTSPPLRPLAPAEQSSDREAATADAAHTLSRLQTQQPGQIPPTPNVSPVEATPLSSVPPSPRVSVAYGSPYPSTSSHGSFHSLNSALTSPALPSLGGYNFSKAPPPGSLRDPTGPHLQDLSSRSAKRTASLTELRSLKSRRDTEGSPQPSDIPTSSTGAQSTPAPRHNAPKRASSRARAPASVRQTSPTNTREPQAGKRSAGRPRKNLPHPVEPQLFSGASAYKVEDLTTPMMPPQSHTTASGDLKTPLKFYNTFKASAPLEHRSAGHPSLGYREPAGASFSGYTTSNTPSPSLSHREPQGAPFFAGPRSAYPRPPGSSTPQSIPNYQSSQPSTPFTLGQSLTSPSPSDSFNFPYGISGVSTSQPPYQAVPKPNPSTFQAQVQASTVEADGYLIIRNAIPIEKVREVVAIIAKGLSVNARSETALIYATPVQAYMVRDAFVSIWRPALHPFYDPMGKTIPKMPKANIVGSFENSDPTSFRKSILHTGSKDEIYVHIALTNLSPDNGFYTLLRGSHQTKHPGLTPVNDWIRTPIDLQEGDALVWRGDLSYLLSSNGGGKWQCLTFEWGPGMIDLTTE